MVGTCGINKATAERLAKRKKGDYEDERFVYDPNSEIQTMKDIYIKK